MKGLFISLLLITGLAANGQYAGIVNSDLFLSGIHNGERIGWKTDVGKLLINKETGEFQAVLAIDEFEKDTENPDFEDGKEKGQYKELLIKGFIPSDLLIQGPNQASNFNTELTLEYNGLRTTANMSFQLNTLRGRGFTLQGFGEFDHRELDVEALKEVDDYLSIQWTIVGV